VNAELNGLAMFTTYHYRLAVTNANGTNRGSEVSFTTPGPPRISNVSAQVNPSEKAGQTSATLNAQINPGGRETTYRFEYGETTAYGTNIPIPDGSIAPSQELQTVPAIELSGLKLATVYHYRLVAHNQYGTATGPDQEFKTLPAALVTASVSDVTATSATLEAQINPLGTDTTYYFQYGTTNCATTPTNCTTTPVPAGDAGAGETQVDVPAVQLRGLVAGTTYRYRVIATSSLGTGLHDSNVGHVRAARRASMGAGVASRQARSATPLERPGSAYAGVGERRCDQLSREPAHRI
jgi:phosphodiesterase/alkaline phosphatase D-like protein